MPPISDAVGLERVSRVTGYKIEKGFFNEDSPYLPQRIAVLCEANHANQGLETSPPTDITVPFQITSSRAAALKCGWGSPANIIADILFPKSGGFIGGIPVWLYVQNEAPGATAQEQTITVTGTADQNVTHTVLVAGRGFRRSGSYDINIQSGDTEDDVAELIQTALSNVLECPVTAALNSPADNEVNTTSKWYGLTADGITISVDTKGKPAGLSYDVNVTANGSGTPDINASLDLFGSIWNTIVINSYGTVDSVMDKLEAFNGVADPDLPTGRYQGIMMKPFIALTGSVDDDPSDITDARKDEMTIAICPAPLSPALAMEAAANMCALFARVCQDTPHLDVGGKYYPDMPVATEPIAMSDYNNRDAFVKKGCSTVDIINGKYLVEDFVTTNHPEGEDPPQFRYCRDIMVDLNIFFGYYLLEQTFVKDHLLANDNDVVRVAKVIRPKEWKRIVGKMADDRVSDGLMADADFLKDSLQVKISGTNPQRFETKFKYKRTGVARIEATTAVAGFNYGSA